MKKLLLLLFAFIFLFSLVSAEVQSLPIQKQYNCVTLTQSCPSCTRVSLELIKYPNSAENYLNSTMTKIGNSYNYSFCNTTQTGTYIVRTCGDVSGTNTCVDYNFKVTSQGTGLFNVDLTSPIVIIFFLIFIGLSIFLLFTQLQYLGSILIIIIGFIILFNGISTLIAFIVITLGVFSSLLNKQK